jgi:hypothetical protein
MSMRSVISRDGDLLQAKTRNLAKRELMKRARLRNEIAKDLFNEMVDRIAVVSVYETYLQEAEDFE